MSKQHIWIIDDHQLFSAGLAQLLASSVPGYAIECMEHPERVLQSATVIDLALVIIDFYIPDSDALYWIPEITKRFPGTPVVVISSSTSLVDRQNALKAGASAYYPKHAPPDLTLKNLMAHIQQEPTDTVDSYRSAFDKTILTDRQIEILVQVGRGHSNKKIAKLLEVSPETVKSHLKSIYRITNCISRDQAADWARRNGMV